MILGPPIRDPKPAEPEWKDYGPNPALEVNARGQLRTKEVELPEEPTLYDLLESLRKQGLIP